MADATKEKTGDAEQRKPRRPVYGGASFYKRDHFAADDTAPAAADANEAKRSNPGDVDGRHGH